MNQFESGCAATRELLPDRAADRLDGPTRARVDQHVATCVECRSELELVDLLLATRIVPPAGLDQAVMGALARRRRPVRRPWWGLSAAAVAAVALGIGITSESRDVGDVSAPSELATEFEEGEFWMSDDGLLAGAPSLDALSDDALGELLEELVAERPGGGA
jgi:hypothetical protein